MDEQKSLIEQRLIELSNEETNFDNVGKVFIDYFGDELVDVVHYNNHNIIYSILNLQSISRFVSMYCTCVEAQSDNTKWKIGLGQCRCYIDKDKYDKIKSEDITHFPEELLPLVDELYKLDVGTGINKIIIRFPEVTVTNEYNKSTKIQELYVRISVRSDGRLERGFEMIRSHYTLEQWNSDYCHSHMPSISKEWNTPCTGSGPINTTMDKLMSEFDTNIWGLFCYELDKFTKVESISGVPYRRLESIGVSNEFPIQGPVFTGVYKLNSSVITEDLLKDFLDFFVKNINIKVSFIDNSYKLGESFNRFWIKTSKIFAIWYNEKYKNKEVKAKLNTLLAKGIVCKYFIKEGKVYNVTTQNGRNFESYQNAKLFTFKGKEVILKIEETTKEENKINETYLLSLRFVSHLLRNILFIINYNYGRQNKTTEEATIKRRKLYF